MNTFVRKSCLSLILLSALIEIIQANKNESNTDARQSRATGRIVKVYSGYKPSPIVCLDEGFKADPTDCSVFYRCVKASQRGNFNIFRYQCGPGTVYDPETEICNHPRSTKRSECGGIILSQENEDANEDNEVGHELPSPISTNLPSHVSQSSPVLISTTANPSQLDILTKSTPKNYYHTTTTVKYEPPVPAYPWMGVSNETYHITLTTVTPLLDKSDPCITDGFIGDHENCRKFYRCVRNSHGSFTRYEFFCSDSTIWDDNIQSCNHAWAARNSRCGRNNDSFKDNQSLNDVISQNIHQQFNYGFKTTEKYNYSKNDVNETNQVEHSNTVDFNRDSNIGNIVNNNKSINRQPNINSVINEETSKANEGLVTQYGNIEKHTTKIYYTEKLSQKETQMQGERSGECLQTGFLGDINDCSKFYRCVDSGNGKFMKYEFSCSQGTVWDSKVEACNHAWAVKECGGLSPIKDVSSTNILTTYAYGDSSPSSSKATTYKITKITTATDSSINKNNPTQVEYSGSVDFNENSNSGYGLNDLNSPSINQPSDVNSGIREETLITQYGNIEKQTTKVYSTENLPQKVTQMQGKISVECSKSGFMGDPNDCSKFYRCVDSGNGKFIKYEFSCSQGTVWDSKIEACNHVWAVKECGGLSPIKGVSSINTLTTTSDSSPSSSKATNYKVTTITTTNDGLISENNDNGYFNPIKVQEETTMPTTVSLISSTTSATQSIKECKETSFFGDENDCQIFYRCVDNGNGGFTKFEYKCGQGTLWDRNIEACNHAWAVKSCGSQSSINIVETTKVSDKTTTTNSYVQATTMSIIPSSEYNKEEKQTEKPNENEINKVSKEPESYKNVCQYVGFVGDSNDCRKFYRCVDDGNGGFIEHQFLCGEGTVWDSSIEACNHARAVKTCGGNMEAIEEIQSSSQSTDSPNTSQNYHSNSTISSSENNSNETSSTTQTLNTTARPISTTFSGTTISNANECSRDGFAGDKYDCKKFYRCVQNHDGGYERHDFYCGDGTLWDPKIQACNHDWAVKECGGNLSAASENNNNEMTTPTASSVEESGNSYTSQSSHESENPNSSTTIRSPTPTTTTTLNKTDKCQSSGFIGDENDCKKFYRCVENDDGKFTVYEFTCGEGTVWDSKITACNHEWAVTKCNSNQNEQIKTTSNPVQSGEVQSSPTQVSTIDSSMDISSTTQTSHISITTTAISIPTTNSSLKDEQKCISDGFFANKNDCKRFFRCVDNGKGSYDKYEFDCGEGTIWVQEIQACDHNALGENCTSNLVTTSSESHKVTSTTNVPNVSYTSSETISSEAAIISTTDELETNTDEAMAMICQNEGFFGNTEDCKKFYRCVSDGKGKFSKYDYICGDGTIWDSEIIACNHPQDVSKPSCRSEHDNSSDINGNHQNVTTEKSTESMTSTSKTTTKSMSTEKETEKPLMSTTISSGTISGSSTTSVSTTSSSNCTDDNSSENLDNQEFKCEKAGFYADKYDCKKFHRCVDWDGNGNKFSVFHFECGDGTIWDPALETCNHESSIIPPRNCNRPQQENVTEPTTTTEKTTTIHSVTTQKTTTQSSTTKVTSTQPTSTESSSSDLSTTQSSSSELSTTQSSSSEQSTTQSSSSEQSTTQSSSSEQSTTQSSSSEQSTTQSSSSEQTTTQSSSSEQSTTSEQSTSSEQSTTQSSSSESLTTQPSTTELSTTQSSSTEQSTTQSSSTEQSTIQLSTTEHLTTQLPVTSDTQAITTEPTTTISNQDQTTKPTTEQVSSTEQTVSTGSTTETTQLTSISTDQTATEQTNTSTEQSTTTEDNISQITEVQSTTSESTSTESSTESSSQQKCPETDSDQSIFVCPTSFKRHPKYCDIFYQCVEDNDTHEVKVTVFNCPNNTIYDESKIQCVEEEKSNEKCNGKIAQKHRVKRLGSLFYEPISVTTQTMACSSAGHFPFEIQEECSEVLLKCELTKSGKLRGFVYKCPKGYVYWTVSRRCESIRKVRDCKRSSYPWNSRYDLPLEKYNIAS